MEVEMGAEPDSSIMAEARLGFWQKRSWRGGTTRPVVRRSGVATLGVDAPRGLGGGRTGPRRGGMTRPVDRCPGVATRGVGGAPSRHPKGCASRLGGVPRATRRGGGRRGRRHRGEEGVSGGAREAASRGRKGRMRAILSILEGRRHCGSNSRPIANRIAGTQAWVENVVVKKEMTEGSAPLRMNGGGRRFRSASLPCQTFDLTRGPDRGGLLGGYRS